MPDSREATGTQLAIRSGRCHICVQSACSAGGVSLQSYQSDCGGTQHYSRECRIESEWAQGANGHMTFPSAPQTIEEKVEVAAGDVSLQGILARPSRPRGVVLFAHGSGSSRHSPRNAFIARALQDADLATLLIDLLSEPEAADREHVFAIDLLADRLLAITRWLNRDRRTLGLRVGYFGASTGAAAALQAAARSPALVSAVVSRGGRPDLAETFLPQVTAPTLLVVGANDAPVLSLNEEALSLLTCPKELAVVPGATHLFEEPGTLEQVADLARGWFQRYLTA